MGERGVNCSERPPCRERRVQHHLSVVPACSSPRIIEYHPRLAEGHRERRLAAACAESAELPTAPPPVYGSRRSLMTTPGLSSNSRMQRAARTTARTPMPRASTPTTTLVRLGGGKVLRS